MIVAKKKNASQGPVPKAESGIELGYEGHGDNPDEETKGGRPAEQNLLEGHN